jgi:hypothetical protein
LRPRQRFDLEASELFLRESLHAVGAGVLQRVLERVAAAAATVVQCAAGHEAALVDYRRKQMLTVLGSIQLLLLW